MMTLPVLLAASIWLTPVHLWTPVDYPEGVHPGLAHEFVLEAWWNTRHERPPAAPHSHRSTPSGVYTGMGNGTSDVARWEPLVAKYFPAGEVERALCVMRLESGGNPTAANPSSSARGLFQVLASLWTPVFGVTWEDLFNPEVNVAVARQIWEIQGWMAWSPYQRGNCR